jgi:predicted MFS family arabinose efflux permease
MADTAAASRVDPARQPVPTAQAGTSDKAPRLATRLVFFMLGFGTSAWAPLVPYAKARLGLDNHALGLLLLCLGCGAFLAMSIAGSAVHRFGCRAVVVCLTAVVILALPVLAVAASLPLMVATLFAFGAALGAFGVVINIQAVIVERASGLPMMSGFHAMYSLGGILGAAGMVGLLGLGAPVFVAALCASLVLLIALPVAMPNLLTHGGAGGGSILAIPKGIVILIGMLCFVMFLAEGAMLDWGAVFLSSTDAMKASSAGLGYTVFAIMMTTGRLSGDAIVARLGRIRLVVVGACCAALGFVIATVAPTWPLALIGFGVIGIGCANVAPSLFTIIGRQTRMPDSSAVAAASTLAYAGVLVGPALIGFVASLTSLHTAFYGLAGALVVVAASARYLPR